MKATASLNVEPVRSYFAELAVYLKKSIPDTIRGEAAEIVRKAMSMQKHSKIAEVKARALRKGVASFRIAAGFGGTTNVSNRKGQLGRQWMVGRKGGKPMPMGIWAGNLSPLLDGQKSPGTKGKRLNRSKNGTRVFKSKHSDGWRAPASDWAKYKQAWAKDIEDTKKRIKDRLAARGITAKSWLEILDKIHGSDSGSVPDFVRRARPISNKSRTVAAVVETGKGSSQFQITVVNASGVAIAAGGARKLASAISIRRAFFKRNMEKGFMFDAKFIARNYKWAKVG